MLCPCMSCHVLAWLVPASLALPVLCPCVCVIDCLALVLSCSCVSCRAGAVSACCVVLTVLPMLCPRDAWYFLSVPVLCPRDVCPFVCVYVCVWTTCVSVCVCLVCPGGRFGTLMPLAREEGMGIVYGTPIPVGPSERSPPTRRWRPC